jgi:hypothetical protein
VPEPKVLRRDQEVFQGTTQADVELASAWVGNRLAATDIREEMNAVALHREGPGLAVFDGGSQDRITEEEAKLGLDRRGYREVLLGNLPHIFLEHGHRTPPERVLISTMLHERDMKTG